MRIPTSVALSLSVLTARQAFEAYDSCALNCFDEFLGLASQCTETVTSQQIACVCGDQAYDYASATCIYDECGATILNQTAIKHEFNCNLNGSPPVLDAQQFVAAGNPNSGDSSFSSILSSYSAALSAQTTYSVPLEATNSPVTIGVSTTPTGQNPAAETKSAGQDQATQTSSSPASSSSASSNGGSNTLSTGSLVGSIVGSITGAIASFTTVYFGWKTYKMKQAAKKEKEAAAAQEQAVES